MAERRLNRVSVEKVTLAFHDCADVNLVHMAIRNHLEDDQILRRTEPNLSTRDLHRSGSMDRVLFVRKVAEDKIDAGMLTSFEDEHMIVIRELFRRGRQALEAS